MVRPFLLCCLLIALASGCVRKSAAADSRVVDLSIASDGEFLAYAPTELTCPAGARVRLHFHHAGQRIPQKHNWVLVKPGAESAVEKAGSAAGEPAGWLPAADARVIAATPLCDPGHDATVEFIAPGPGTYPFICTTPGHAAEMHGTLHVTSP